MVLECRVGVGMDSLGMKRIGQHGFPCGLWYVTPRRLEAAVLHQPLAGPVNKALEGGLCPGPLSQLLELPLGPALPPLSLGGAVALGGGVGVGGCCRVVGTGGVGGPGGFLVVLCRGGAWGAGAWADVDPQVRAHVPRLKVWLGFAVPAVAGQSSGCGLTSIILSIFQWVFRISVTVSDQCAIAAEKSKKPREKRYRWKK